MATNSTNAARSRASTTKDATNGSAPAESEMVDQIAEDAKPDTLPDGAPTLTPYLKLPYRKRGAFMEKMAKVQEMAPKPKTTAKAPRKSDEGQIDLAEISGYYYLLAELDELMRLVGDDAEIDAWQGGHNDAEFVELYNRYMRWSQAGEASSSAS